jgi:hypothetical protein
VAWLFLSHINGIVASAIETYGSEATGTSVSVGSVDVSITNGSATLGNLEIGNPDGYDSPYAIKLKTVRVGLDISSLKTDTIVMKQAIVKGASVYAEMKGRQSNLSQILDNVEHFVGPSKPQQQPAGNKKFVVKTAQLKNTNTTVLLDKLDKKRTIDIPDISVHNIGVKSGGVNAADLVKQLLRPVIQRVLDEARNSVKQKALEKAHKKVDELKNKAHNKLKNKLKDLGNSGSGHREPA